MIARHSSDGPAYASGLAFGVYRFINNPLAQGTTSVPAIAG